MHRPVNISNAKNIGMVTHLTSIKTDNNKLWSIQRVFCCTLYHPNTNTRYCTGLKSALEKRLDIRYNKQRAVSMHMKITKMNTKEIDDGEQYKY